jgi:hypothetical protein
VASPVSTRTIRTGVIPARALALAIFALAVACGDERSHAPGTAISGEAPASAQRPDQFVLDRLAIESDTGGDRRSSLNASRLVSRKRTGLAGFVTYHDVLEVLLIEASLSIEIDSEEDPGFADLVADLKRSLPSSALFTALSGTADGIPRRTARLLFDGLSLRATSAGERTLLLSSKQARLNLDPEALVLEGDLRISLAGGVELRGPLAAISPKHEGIYLPLGYALGADYVDQTAFLSLDDAGEWSRAAVVPAIQLDDSIESKEQAVLAHLLERAPGGLRGLLFAILARVGADPAEPGSGSLSLLATQRATR